MEEMMEAVVAEEAAAPPPGVFLLQLYPPVKQEFL